MWFGKKSLELPKSADALPGRAQKMRVAPQHAVLGRPLEGPFPEHLKQIFVGMGCFWGAERKFWKLQGVWTTAVGYAGGMTENASYDDVCSGRTGHTEVVLVVYDPAQVSTDVILKTFWENHDPTQGMRQGNDIGTQYRSAIYTCDEDQKRRALASRDVFQAALSQAGHGPITTEIRDAPAFYYAEDHHQQYLHKNPDGYCGLGGTGVTCPVALST